MKVEYINPFIESVQEVLSTMLGCKAERGEVGLAGDPGGTREVTALIGLSGVARGTVVLSFPITTALRMVSRLTGVDIRIPDETVSDGVAELVNMVAGGAKARFYREGGTPIDLSLPSVVRGNDYTVDHPTGSIWLEVPFRSDLGAFSLRVTFEMDGDQQGGKGE